jgi:anti-sigma-K factor RskA
VADADDLEALAGEYVLGTLDADERRAAEARLTADAAFRSAVAGWARRLQPLADLAPDARPPADAFARILATIGASPAAPAGGNVCATPFGATLAGHDGVDGRSRGSCRGRG